MGVALSNDVNFGIDVFIEMNDDSIIFKVTNFWCSLVRNPPYFLDNPREILLFIQLSLICKHAQNEKKSRKRGENQPQYQGVVICSVYILFPKKTTINLKMNSKKKQTCKFCSFFPDPQVDIPYKSP